MTETTTSTVETTIAQLVQKNLTVLEDKVRFMRVKSFDDLRAAVANLVNDGATTHELFDSAQRQTLEHLAELEAFMAEHGFPFKAICTQQDLCIYDDEVAQRTISERCRVYEYHDGWQSRNYELWAFVLTPTFTVDLYRSVSFKATSAAA